MEGDDLSCMRLLSFSKWVPCDLKCFGLRLSATIKELLLFVPDEPPKWNDVRYHENLLWAMEQHIFNSEQISVNFTYRTKQTSIFSLADYWRAIVLIEQTTALVETFLFLEKKCHLCKTTLMVSYLHWELTVATLYRHVCPSAGSSFVHAGGGGGLKSPNFEKLKKEYPHLGYYTEMRFFCEINWISKKRVWSPSHTILAAGSPPGGTGSSLGILSWLKKEMSPSESSGSGRKMQLPSLSQSHRIAAFERPWHRSKINSRSPSNVAIPTYNTSQNVRVKGGSTSSDFTS